MSNNYHNAENIIKRVDGLLELGKQEEALDSLYDALKNRKSRLLIHTHESIINKLLEICVERKFSGFVKGGLHAYRIICQDINIKSWEDAVKKLLSLVETKIEETIKELQTSLVDVSCFDQTMTPESLLKISYNGSETRLIQISLLSWVKFKWECFRICVELLRNSHFEKFYHFIVQSAFKFCLKYSHKVAFRKLCHSLRMHVNYLKKRHTNLFMEDKNSEITTLYLETGIAELNTALDMELWHEAFKVAEDFHLLMKIVKQPINSKIMAIYYEKLSMLFLKGNDLLFHAAALFQYFLLYKEVRKNFISETTVLSSRVIIAVLSIPFDVDYTIESVVEKNPDVFDKKLSLLSTLLNLPNKPTRKLLIRNLNQYNIIQYSHTEIQNLFNLLENEVDPLNMGIRLKNITDTISELDNQISLKQYFPSLFSVSCVRLLSQLSKIYETLALDKFFSFVPFLEHTFAERLIVDSARKYNIPVRIDQSRKSLFFNNSFNLLQNQSTIDGPECYQLSDNQTMHCLSHLLTSFTEIKRIIKPDGLKFESVMRVMVLQDQYFKNKSLDRKRILKRKKLIEQHKEFLENLRRKKEADKKKLFAEKQSEQEEVERLRLQKEAEERAKQRRILEEEEIKKQIFQERMEILKNSEIGQVIEKLELNKLSSTDSNSLLSKQMEYVKRGKIEFQFRLYKQERTYNHMERAKRIEEIPLRIQEHENDKIKIREVWDNDEKCRIQRICGERYRVIENRERMLVMKDDLNNFMKKVLEGRKLEYEKEYRNFLKDVERVREKRLIERSMQRKAERRKVWLEQKKYLEKDRDSDFKLVKRHDTRNYKKLNRERSIEKSSRFETSPEFRIENFFPSPCSSHQAKLIKLSNQEPIQSSSIRHNKVNVFYDQLDRTQHVPTKKPLKKDINPHKNSQPNYHILKRNENLFTDNVASKEQHFSKWGTMNDPKNFGKQFFVSTDNLNSQSYTRKNASICSNLSSTIAMLETNSKYSYSPIYCEEEKSGSQDTFSYSSAESKDTFSLFSVYNRRMVSEYQQDSEGGKIFNRENEKFQSNVEKKLKYSETHSCTPWAKLKRANNTKPDSEC